MKSIFPNFNVKIVLTDLSKYQVVGLYNSRSDMIFVDRSLKSLSKLYKDVVILHELFHSTINSKRTLRLERLISQFGEYKRGSLSFKTEECIAEICTMIACLKLGKLNKYTQIIIDEGLNENYTEGMYIPWMEVVSALTYYSNDEIDFTKEIDYVKCFLIAKYNMNIKNSYLKIAG